MEMQKFTVVLENWDGKCKRATVEASNAQDAWGVAMVKFPRWMPVDVIAK